MWTPDVLGVRFERLLSAGPRSSRVHSGNHIDEASGALGWRGVRGLCLGLLLSRQCWERRERRGVGRCLSCGSVLWLGVGGCYRRAFESVAVVAVFEMLPEGANRAAVGVNRRGHFHAGARDGQTRRDTRRRALVGGEGRVPRAEARGTLPTILE